MVAYDVGYCDDSRLVSEARVGAAVLEREREERQKCEMLKA